jgi:uncharacterized protein DUF3574
MTKALLAGLLAAAAVLGGTRAGSAADTAGCRAPLEAWTEIDLYLGRDIAGDGTVTEAEFRRFLSEVVTPRFPDGLSVLDVAGQFRDGKGRIVREPSKLLVVLVPDASAAAKKVGQIIAAYEKRFRQESVLHAEHPVCVSFTG